MYRRTLLSMLPVGGLVRSTSGQNNNALEQDGAELTDRGLENLTAFARLFGYIRHFHPSDEAEVADWDSLTVAGVRVVERASNPAALVTALQDVFRPVAPTLRVFTGGSRPALWSPSRDPETLKKVFWRHRGYRTEVDVPDWMSWWTRQRIVAPSDGAPEIIRVDLGAGVLASVPITLLADEVGTLPYVKGREPFAPKLPAASSFTGDDRATRLAGVVIAWNAFEHFYPYFDVVRADWAKALHEALMSAATASAQSFVRTLRRLTARAQDGHCKVFWDAAHEPDALAPIGWDWVEDQLVITDVPDPQGQSIRAGDVVHRIDGKAIAEVMREAKAEVSAPTRQWLIARLISPDYVAKRKFGSLGEGPQSQPLVLEVGWWRNPTERRTVKLERRMPRRPVREQRPAHLSELKPGVLYVDLTRMSVADWNAAVTRMAGAAGLVLDVRGYPRLDFAILGNLSRAPLLQHRFYAPVITHPDRKRWEFHTVLRTTVQPSEPYVSGRKVFLTDGRAISFADSWMAMVENYRLGQIVGEATAGTSGNANRIMLPGGYGIFFTGEKVLRHDGSRYHGVGVKPTVPVARTLQGVAAGRDEVVERALELLA